jgi:hypothetical protein
MSKAQANRIKVIEKQVTPPSDGGADVIAFLLKDFDDVRTWFDGLADMPDPHRVSAALRHGYFGFDRSLGGEPNKETCGAILSLAILAVERRVGHPLSGDELRAHCELDPISESWFACSNALWCEACVARESDGKPFNSFEAWRGMDTLLTPECVPDCAVIGKRHTSADMERLYPDLWQKMVDYRNSYEVGR